MTSIGNVAATSILLLGLSQTIGPAPVPLGPFREVAPEAEPVPEAKTAPADGEVPAKVFDTVRADLAKRTGAKAEAMKVVRAQAVVFSDGSLGCGRKGREYTQAIVPGYQVILALDGKQYDYRATRQGSFMLCERGPRAR
jgi:hypothetical protein